MVDRKIIHVYGCAKEKHIFIWDIKMRACVVGCGTQCEWTWGSIAQHFNGIDWVDTDIDRAQYFWDLNSKAQHMSSYGKEVKTDNVDLGVVLTPNGLHREIAEQFIEKDIPVFIEKPIALSWEDLEWFEEVERYGAWITTGFQCRFLDTALSIRDALRNDTPIIINCWKHRGRSQAYYSDGWHGTWKYDGGVMTQQGIHALDIVCFITGETPNFVSMLGSNFKHDIQCEDTALLSLEYDDFVATIHMTTAMDDESMAGGHSGLLVTSKAGFCAAQGFAFEQMTAWKNMKTLNGLYYTNMWSEIINALKTGDPPPVPASEAVKSMKIAHAAYASWHDNGTPKPYGTKFDLLGK
jgi:predicted dehydrogenase